MIAIWFRECFFIKQESSSNVSNDGNKMAPLILRRLYDMQAYQRGHQFHYQCNKVVFLIAFLAQMDRAYQQVS